jgi:hypothetical protein
MAICARVTGASGQLLPAPQPVWKQTQKLFSYFFQSHGNLVLGIFPSDCLIKSRINKYGK